MNRRQFHHPSQITSSGSSAAPSLLKRKRGPAQSIHQATHSRGDPERTNMQRHIEENVPKVNQTANMYFGSHSKKSPIHMVRHHQKKVGNPNEEGLQRRGIHVHDRMRKFYKKQPVGVEAHLSPFMNAK